MILRGDPIHRAEEAARLTTDGLGSIRSGERTANMKTSLLNTAAHCGPQADAAVSGRGFGQLLANRNPYGRARLAVAWKRGEFDIERTTKHGSMLFGVSGSLIRQEEERQERGERQAKQSEAGNGNGVSDTDNGNGTSDAGYSDAGYGANGHGETSPLVEAFVRAWATMGHAERVEVGRNIGPRELWDDAVGPNLR
jgi:hypothetical protein